MNPAKWPAGLLAAVLILLAVLIVSARFLPSDQAWGMLGQIVTSAADLAP
jgi:hypothetical protein